MGDYMISRYGMLTRIFILVLCVMVFSSACESQSKEITDSVKGEAFELYLLADETLLGGDIREYELEDLTLTEEPLISTEDIVEYAWEDHRITLTEDSYQNIMEKFSGEIPLVGKPFVILSDGEPIYAGAFWSMLSSMSFDGVTIIDPMYSDKHQIQITLGYPTEAFFSSEDPRFDPRIKQALEEAGLLVE